MPRTSFLGRIVERSQAPAPECDWRNLGPRWAMSLTGPTAGGLLYTWDALALLIRGVVRLRDSTESLDLDRVAEEIRVTYLETGALPTERLEGGFSIVLLDAATERALVYRNVGASANVYYRTDAGLVLGGNLGDLVAGCDLDAETLPAFHLYGIVPGRDTLTADCHRLLPGELLQWERGRLTVREVPCPPPSAGDLDATLGQVLADSSLTRPAVVLTGGPASARLQAVVNDTIRTELLPRTFSVSANDPASWAATERAMRAARRLGTEHRLVPVEGDLADHVRACLAVTGEPPLRPDLAYLPALARAMTARGQRSVILALGAGAVFGSLAGLDRAETLRRTLPAWLRYPLGKLAGLVGAQTFAEACWQPARADDPRHPLARATPAARGDVRSRFGKSGLRAAIERRRPAIPEGGTLRERCRGLLLVEALETAAQAIELFNAAGLDVACPYLDSRCLAFAGRSDLGTTPRAEALDLAHFRALGLRLWRAHVLTAPRAIPTPDPVRAEAA